MIDTYKTQIRGGGVYIIKNFKVQEATTYRPVNNDFKIVFISDVIGLLCSISTLQKITIMKSSNNPRMKDIYEIEILLFG